MKQLIDSSAIAHDDGALRARMSEDGYLYFPGLLPREHVTGVRADIAAVLRDSRWLAPDSEPDELRASDRVVEEGGSTFFGMYSAVQATQSFHELSERAELRDLAQRLLGEEVFCHPMHIARVTAPTPRATPTPAHQDYRLIQGAVDTLTMWIPLADCPADAGGLEVLSGSHRLGVLGVSRAEGPGGVSAQVAGSGVNDWRTAHFGQGDVLVFTSLTVHGARPNLSDRLRLSADIRWQARSEPAAFIDGYEPFRPHFHPDVPDWPTLSRGWTSTTSVEIPEGLTYVRKFDSMSEHVPTPPSRFR
ncbi:phytanoyl-CoA dioxygenase family protein [Allokutzneria sp. NRRL B-24872]|uniref:phytanoyl-CoA dioxygenase family protein n=1 Tax=Allokutzneria sp. NRRL B-24872 TaxID=1137961 RepID=UPI000A36559B|nr:phytanoyl-CoA dioxygenase family protein [Allokutzneria sp. NRRL B-24872]